MRKLLGLCASLLLVVFLTPSTTAFAATDVTGTWTTQVFTPSGNVTVLVHLKQIGDRLTGQIEASAADEPIPISNGRITGDKLSFDASLNGLTLSQVGTVSGDQIKLTATATHGEFPSVDVTLKRQGQR
ncbi:hypothetical protein DYQ86_14875 [Acidobacteria bacterium AB60]|nr:hypothetical protein DYQ86_14875 [Acidobacteria bacterium AB60]